MESQGCSREEIGSQLQSVRESHAMHTRKQRQMLQEREEVYKEAIAESLTPEEAKARVQACAQWQQQMPRCAQGGFNLSDVRATIPAQTAAAA